MATQGAFSKATGTDYRIMRQGKTARDKRSGAWQNRLKNRAKRAKENSDKAK